MPESPEKIREAAACWVSRLAAGLDASEEEQFEAWIEADPRHTTILADQQAIWDRFRALEDEAAGTAPDPGRYDVRSSDPWVRWAVVPLLAAAAVVCVVFLWTSSRSPLSAQRPAAVVQAGLPLPLSQRLLPDGSLVDLNRGADITVAFSGAERRVVLLKGEANFSVARNPVPFVVAVGGVELRALGTAFNVRYDPHAVEVVVTEGRVQVATSAALASADTPSLSVLAAGQSTTISLSQSGSAPIATLTTDELAQRLAWQPKLLDFDDVPLIDIAAAFNRANSVRLVLRDPTLQSLRLNASFRSDNMEGFVRLLETHFGIEAEPLSASEIVLRRRK